MSAARRLSPIIAFGLALVLATGAAWAYWSVTATPGGNGASAASTVGSGATPDAVATGRDVTVNWDPSRLSDGEPVAGYLVTRYDADRLVRQTILAGCDGIVAATACTENDLPAGRWVYSITPVLGLHWAGAESARSNPVLIDTTLPVNAISVTALTGGAASSGNTVYYRGVAAGSLILTNAVTDADSGPVSSTTSTLAGTSTGWSHTPSTVSTPAGGPYVSNPFSWAQATASAPTEAVTGRDQAGNAITTTLGFVDDSTAPSAGAITYPDGYQPGPSIVVSFTAGSDSGSGVATRQLQRSSAVLAAGACGPFTAFAGLGPDNPSSPYTDADSADGSCYQYRFVVTDRVGNQDVATSANVARVDSAAGGPHLGGAGGFSVLAGTGVVSTGLTVVSGDLGVSPGGAITGFPPGVVAGTVHAGDVVAAQARSDLGLAFDDAAARVPGASFAGDLNGLTFHAGVYHSAAALALTGTLTLDGENDPNAVFIFQVDAAMNTAAGSSVVLIRGAQASHVFWQVDGAAGTGALSSLSGTIMAAGAITLGAGSVLIGRALSYGTVTLAANTIRFTAALPPSVTIDGGATVVTKDTTPTITGTTSAAPGRTVTTTVAGQVLTATVQGDQSWSVTATALAAGTYVVLASVRDASGNAGTATQTLTVEVNPAPVVLGGAGGFSVLAGTGVVSTGLTVVSGDLGVSPGGAITGFPPGVVAGTVHAGDVVAAQARSDLGLAFDDAAARVPGASFAGDLNGLTFHAGVYHSAAALALTGTLTLDGENDPNAVFIFQVDAAMNTAAGSSVVLIRGAQASHVFWQVDGAAGTGALSSLSGTIMAAGAITLGAGSVLIGRALSYGTVTLAANTITTG